MQDMKMGFEKWQKKMNQLNNCAILRDFFHVISITLLSLLLPLSFLLLARLSTANSVSYFIGDSSQYSVLFSIFLYTNPTLVHALVAIVSVATLVHGLTGKITFQSDQSSSGPRYRPHLYTAWIFLCTLQVCVGLGIEASIAAGVEGTNLGDERSLFSRVIFFLGLHETMLHWSRTVVKPVVDDTIFGDLRDEKWVEKAAMAVSFCILWWWRLRDEVESLVIVAEVKKEMNLGVGLADFVGWWFYYLTVTIGMVRIVKAVLYVSMIFVCRRWFRVVEGGNSGGDSPDDNNNNNNDEKV